MWTGFEEGLAGPLNRVRPVPRTSLLTHPRAPPPRTCVHPDCLIRAVRGVETLLVASRSIAGGCRAYGFI
eukprot:2064437-Prymnesium_polylepis.1